jgi:membrane protein YqaA with SNARE-associated domain
LISAKFTLSKYTGLIWGALKPLGAWGVFAIAGIDGMGIPLPGAVDVVVATYVYNKPLMAWWYVIVASLGSLLGCLVLYFIGYQGGEVLLRKRMSPEKFERTRQSFEKHRLLALMFPAMLPPPFPFKVFVLSAAVFEMKLSHFVAAIFAGRLIRFSILAILTIKFGPQFVQFMGTTIRQHFGIVILGLAVLTAIALLMKRLRQPRTGETVRQGE